MVLFIWQSFTYSAVHMFKIHHFNRHFPHYNNIADISCWIGILWQPVMDEVTDKTNTSMAHCIGKIGTWMCSIQILHLFFKWFSFNSWKYLIRLWKSIFLSTRFWNIYTYYKSITASGLLCNIYIFQLIIMYILYIYIYYVCRKTYNHNNVILRYQMTVHLIFYKKSTSKIDTIFEYIL